jgi:cytosine/creatinine deaminase
MIAFLPPTAAASALRSRWRLTGTTPTARGPPSTVATSVLNSSSGGTPSAALASRPNESALGSCVYSCRTNGIFARSRAIVAVVPRVATNGHSTRQSEAAPNSVTYPVMSDDVLAADRVLMALALEQAHQSLEAGGVPVGAVLAAGGEVLAAGHNERVQHGDPVAHGEIACLRNAGRRPSYADTTLYTTLSPCHMCTGAILLFQIPRVVVGEARTFEGDLDFLRGRGVEIVLLDDPACVAAMEAFQTRFPQVWSEDIGGR